MFLVVQGSCSVLHNDALGGYRDIKCCKVSVASAAAPLAVPFLIRVVVFMVVCYGIGIS